MSWQQVFPISHRGAALPNSPRYQKGVLEPTVCFLEEHLTNMALFENRLRRSKLYQIILVYPNHRCPFPIGWLISWLVGLFSHWLGHYSNPKSPPEILWAKFRDESHHFRSCQTKQGNIWPNEQLQLGGDWNMAFMTFHILGIRIPTDFHIFSDGLKPPTRL